MRFSKLVHQKQLGKVVTLVLLWLVITSSSIQDRISLSLTTTRSLNLRKISAMTWIRQQLHYTQPWALEGEGWKGPWPLPAFEIWHFPIIFLAKKVVYLVSSWKKLNFTIFALPTKILGFTWKIILLPSPGTHRLVNCGQLLNHSALMRFD